MLCRPRSVKKVLSFCTLKDRLSKLRAVCFVSAGVLREDFQSMRVEVMRSQPNVYAILPFEEGDTQLFEIQNRCP